MKKAFSLIELSIVILIIGILIAGVTQGSRLVGQMRIASARALTQSSPVPSMRNLVVWLESTSEASFADAETEDGTNNITTWNDINPTSSFKNSPTQSTVASKPSYVSNCINGLPCARFSLTSTADFMTFASTFGSNLVGSDYTIFVVEQRRTSSSTFYLGGTDTTTTNGNLHLGYRDSTTVGWSQWVNDYSITVTAYSSPTPAIHAFRFSSSTGKTYHLNGALQTLVGFGGTPTPTQGLVSYAGVALGRAGTSNYEGDLAEVIIFNRALTTEERTSTQTYLSKKWGIKI